MATDSTELTFVRCPHCRSLVPAMSKVCRMCGESLDTAAKVEEPDHSKRSSRIRQRTMSRPNDELNQAASKLREEMGAVASAESGDAIIEEPAVVEAPSMISDPILEASPTEAETDEIIEDPLGAYIEEINDTEAGKNPASSSVVKTLSENSDVEADEASQINEAPAATTLAEKRGTDANHSLGSAGTSSPEESTSEAVSSRPRVIVESGTRRVGKPSGLSFGRPKELPKAERTDGPDRLSQDNRDLESPKVSRPAADRESMVSVPKVPPAANVLAQPSSIPSTRVNTQRTEAPSIEREKQPAATPPVERVVRVDDSPGAIEQNGSYRASRDRAAVTSNSEFVRESIEASGRLFGWLVSYAHPDGVAFELREGKFFVTQSSLKSSDFIIDDDSVSTPHALVVVDVKQGLKIQDLMSERGVFIRKSEGGNYQRANETVQVEHGDWIRFGDVEYLVSLIAHVGAA